jgi:hypothetical protein
MYQPIQLRTKTHSVRNSINLSPLRRALFLIAFLLACFALSPSAQAIGPEPEAGDLNGNATEEKTTVLDLSTEAGEGAMGQPDETPNHRVIEIKSIETAPCAFSEKVTLDGLCRLHVSFGFKEVKFNGRVFGREFREKNATVTGFSGTGQKTHRKYVAKQAVITVPNMAVNDNGHGNGHFTLVVPVTGYANPKGKPDPLPGKDFHFRLRYTVHWESVDNKVTLFKHSREIKCK